MRGPSASPDPDGPPPVTVAPAELVRAGSPQGRWVLFATIAGSGLAQLDGTVVETDVTVTGNHTAEAVDNPTAAPELSTGETPLDATDTFDPVLEAGLATTS